MLHYVVVRGRVPGIHSDPVKVLSYITDIPNTNVQVFSTLHLAELFWATCLLGHSVVLPLGTPPAPPVFSSRRISLLNLADSKIPIQGPGEKLPYDRVFGAFPPNWYHFDISLRYEGGPYWIVASGRIPGIYEDWGKAHNQIHGLTVAYERYQKVCDYPSAKLLFKRLASLGLIFVVDIDDPEVVVDPRQKYCFKEDMDGCSACMDVTDANDPNYARVYVKRWGPGAGEEYFPEEDTDFYD